MMVQQMQWLWVILCKEELRGIMKASVVNRFWFSFLGKYSYIRFIKIWEKFKNPLEVFSKMYKPNLLSFILLQM